MTDLSENLTIVLLVLGLVTLTGVGSMIWAYQGGGSIAVLFLEVIPPPITLEESSRRSFETGIRDYCSGHYSHAIASFTQVIKQSPDCPEAHHNYALAMANQRQDDKATAAFLKTADLYAKQDDRAGVDLVKSHLIALRQRKRDREAKASKS